eukprot:scaffold61838_cov69-Attheya_sp.AAC.3
MNDQQIVQTYNHMVLRMITSSARQFTGSPRDTRVGYYIRIKSVSRRECLGHSGERCPKVVRECRTGGGWMANEMPPWAAYRAMIATVGV